ncbi:MAG: phospho-N-acetylmuramoyl-pentapeptide-transferase [Clostridiales bacterium]|jgi:phospho-N-acetylmuramoyl-pentapeptide-transferase|nr:phospho-N-acetylmuramoyl-pentapeptide-transferase [Clostridiales bacterium]
MEIYKRLIFILLAGLASLFASMIIAPAVIGLMRRIKAGQPILKYLDNHGGKSGTPTMGGFIFIIPAVIAGVYFGGLALAAALTVSAYGLIGFLDDFIKVRYKKNQGLTALQKLVGQLGAAVIVSWFAYKNQWVGDVIKIPFTGIEIKLGIWFLALSVFMFLATVNSVNLTDGLDGLAGTTGFVVMLALLASCVVYYFEADYYGEAGRARELYGLAGFAAVCAFSLVGFLWHNASPARIFMGDTGALALGGAVCCAAVFMRNPLLIAIICAVYVWSSLSVILQVAGYKLTGRRLFKIAPYHHHLERGGMSEGRIATVYAAATVAASLAGIVSVLMNVQ